MNPSRSALTGVPPKAHGPAFAVHRLALYIACAAILIDQLLR